MIKRELFLISMAMLLLAGCISIEVVGRQATPTSVPLDLNTGTTKTATIPAMTSTPPPETPASSPSPSPAPPKIADFQACLNPCNGANAEETFPEKTERIHLQWKYENIPAGAHYVRYWTLEGEGVWVKYDCTWSGPPWGQEDLELFDLDGLPSGIWTLVITVNGQIFMSEQIVIEGDWENWAPAGTFTSCYFEP